MSENVLPGQSASGEIKVDGEFLKEHIPGMMSTFLQALAKSIVPGEVKIPLKQSGAPAEPTQREQPEGSAGAEGEPEAPQPTVTLKFDFSALFQGLGKPAGEPDPKA
jgi:hypothetical protein